MKAEMLQKKGYKLYSLAPVPLLLYLLREDAAAMSGGGCLQKPDSTQQIRFSRDCLCGQAGRQAVCNTE